MTLSQKILAHHARGLDRPYVKSGDVLRIRVDWTIASELAWSGMDKTYQRLGRPPIHDPERFYLAVDHTVDPVTLIRDPRVQKLTESSRAFARERGIHHFYDANVTILHTKFYRDLVLPGDLVLGADSHTSSHGGLGAFAIGLGGADITAAMVLGESWIEVPDAVRVEYVGTPPFGIGGKDIILKTLGDLGCNTVAMERSVEYCGDHVRGWSTDMRFTIANMTAELGGLNGIFEADATAAAWIARRPDGGVRDGARYFRADSDAPYVARVQIDLDRLGPQIAVPFSPDRVAAIEHEAGRALHGAFIGACTTTEEELVLAALVLEAAHARGERPVASASRIVVPGDQSILRNLREAGLWDSYERAGFAIDPPGCSMCIGVASRKAGRDEVWLSSQNRNFRNRMGEGSLAYLASAATVAASALGMVVRDPRPLLAEVDRARFARVLGRDLGRSPEVITQEPVIELAPARDAAAPPAPIAERTLHGRVQRFGDHVDTDAIIPGEFCHLTDLAALGARCFTYVRPDFPARVRAGDNVIVAGFGWGSGSSREQAVWALQGAGVIAVVARSFAFIHKRNLVNEALPLFVVDDPAFYERARDGAEISIAVDRGELTVDGVHHLARATTRMVQGLARAGGLVPAIEQHGRNAFASLCGG